MTMVICFGGLGVNLIVQKATGKRTDWGAKPMLAIGTVILLATLWSLIDTVPHDPGDHKVWPIALATGGFVYLWWLATLVFDLSFIWHWYIRQSDVNKPFRSDRSALRKAARTAAARQDDCAS